MAAAAPTSSLRQWFPALKEIPPPVPLGEGPVCRCETRTRTFLIGAVKGLLAGTHSYLKPLSKLEVESLKKFAPLYPNLPPSVSVPKYPQAQVQQILTHLTKGWEMRVKKHMELVHPPKPNFVTQQQIVDLLKSVERQQTNLNERIEALLGIVTTLGGENAQLRAEVNELKARFQRMSAVVAEARALMAALNASVGGLNATVQRVVALLNSVGLT